MHTFNFFDRKGKLTVRINKGKRNERRERSIGYDTKGLFNGTQFEGRTQHATEGNLLIAKISKAITEAKTFESAVRAVENFQDKPEPEEKVLLVDLLKEYADGCMTGEIRSRGRKMNEGHIQNVISAVNAYTRFSNEYRSLNAYEADLLNCEQKQRVKLIKRVRSHWVKYIDWLQEEGKENGDGYKVSTQNTYTGILITVLKWIKDNKGIVIPRSLEVPPTFYDQIHLPLDFVPKYIKGGVPMDDVERNIHFMSIVQIYTTLRVGDLISLDGGSVSEVPVHFNGVLQKIPYIVKMNQKSKKITGSPVREDVYERILWYIDRNGGYLMPYEMQKLSQKTKFYNSNLREILSRFPEMQEHPMIYKQRPDGEIVETTEYAWYEIITSHNMRKTGGNFYANCGVNQGTVKQLLGHSQNSQAFHKHYIDSANLVDADSVLKAQGLLTN